MRGLQLRRGPGRVPLKPRSPITTGPSARVSRLVLERDGFSCLNCGVSVIEKPYTLYARWPGGWRTADNYVTLCGTDEVPGCRSACDRREQVMNSLGFWLRPGEDPALVPVIVATVAGPARMWLTESGESIAEPQEGVAP